MLGFILLNSGDDVLNKRLKEKIIKQLSSNENIIVEEDINTLSRFNSHEFYLNAKPNKSLFFVLENGRQERVEFLFGRREELKIHNDYKIPIFICNISLQFTSRAYYYNNIHYVYLNTKETNLNVFNILDLIPKVAIIGRFNPLHKGHTLIFETAAKISPIIDVYIRKEDRDMFDIETVKEFIKLGSPVKINNIYETPKIGEKEEFADDFKRYVQRYMIDRYDYLVQGNPDVLKYIYDEFSLMNDYQDRSLKVGRMRLIYVPRISDISATKIRQLIKEEKFEELKYYLPEKVIEKILSIKNVKI